MHPQKKDAFLMMFLAAVQYFLGVIKWDGSLIFLLEIKFHTRLLFV
jgi:hypothetical protein